MSESKFTGHINGVIEQIVCACSMEEEIGDILAKLSLVDWKTVLEKKAYERRLRRCGTCGEWKDSQTFQAILIQDARGNSGTNSTSACPDCIKKASFKATCIICLDTYPSQIAVKSFTCFHCFTGQTQIDNNNSRARMLKLPATLTLHEWTTTLRHFKYSCAYCGGKYECMEHYIPLKKKGNAGTTITNCLPSCYRCNTTKKDKHPGEFAPLFPADNIARIQAYFASVA